MGRGKAPGKSPASGRPSRKAANALGYAKRQSLKSKALGPGLSDVYEYQQEKVRRAKIKPLLEKDETMGMGAAGSEDEDEGEEGTTGRRRNMKPRLVGENDDDMGIAEEDDEEIDSDEAFEESDEERFAGFSFSQKVCLVNEQLGSESSQMIFV